MFAVKDETKQNVYATGSISNQDYLQVTLKFKCIVNFVSSEVQFKGYNQLKFLLLNSQGFGGFPLSKNNSDLQKHNVFPNSICLTLYTIFTFYFSNIFTHNQLLLLQEMELGEDT